MGMNFLIASLIWGSVGVGFVIFGKKQGSMIPLVGGFALIGVSYFVSSALSMSLTGIVLIGAMYWFIRQGY